MKSRNRRRMMLAYGMCAALTCAPLMAQSNPSSPVIRTQEGPVQGTVSEGVAAFTGIPFAAPPLGPLRFRAPQPVQPWTTTLLANRKIPNCIQFGGENGTAQGSNADASEDCLYLSVWVPESAKTAQKPLPVLFWIYGSAFVESGPQGYNGQNLAKNGVIVVTSNYRLGLLGQMVHPSLDEPGQLSGNDNIRDTQAALRWVQRNIAAFGGDPKNVTLFGQSAGALGVDFQLLSPQSKGLFSKAVIQSTHSGAATERPAIDKREEVEAGLTQKVLKKTGCDSIADVAACLRALPYQALVDAHTYIAHVTDPALLPADMHEAFKAGNFNRVPLMIGNVEFEGAYYVELNERKLGHPLTEADLPAQAKEFFGDAGPAMLTAYPASKYGTPEKALVAAVSDYRLACAADSTRRAVLPYVPVYAYEMTEKDPEQKGPDRRYTNLPNMAHHASELNYIYGGGWNDTPFKTERAKQLSVYFQTAWANFAKYGTPDPTGKVWPRFTEANPAVMGMQQPPVLGTDFVARHQCDVLKARGFVKY